MARPGPCTACHIAEACRAPASAASVSTRASRWAPDWSGAGVAPPATLRQTHSALRAGRRAAPCLHTPLQRVSMALRLDASPGCRRLQEQLERCAAQALGSRACLVRGLPAGDAARGQHSFLLAAQARPASMTCPLCTLHPLPSCTAPSPWSADAVQCRCPTAGAGLRALACWPRLGSAVLAVCNLPGCTQRAGLAPASWTPAAGRPCRLAASVAPWPVCRPSMHSVQVVPGEAFRMLDRGPPAESADAAAFRAFWGDRAELRRFQVLAPLCWPRCAVLCTGSA